MYERNVTEDSQSFLWLLLPNTPRLQKPSMVASIAAVVRGV